MFTLQLQRQKSKQLRPWEWSHWKADKICYRKQGAHKFDNFFDHIFLQTLCFMINFKDKKISSEKMCTLYSVGNFISFPMGPFPRSQLLAFLSLELQSEHTSDLKLTKMAKKHAFDLHCKFATSSTSTLEPPSFILRKLQKKLYLP